MCSLSLFAVLTLAQVLDIPSYHISLLDHSQRSAVSTLVESMLLDRRVNHHGSNSILSWCRVDS